MGEPRGHCAKLNNPDTGEKKKNESSHLYVKSKKGKYMKAESSSIVGTSGTEVRKIGTCCSKGRKLVI